MSVFIPPLVAVMAVEYLEEDPPADKEPRNHYLESRLGGYYRSPIMMSSILMSSVGTANMMCREHVLKRFYMYPFFGAFGWYMGGWLDRWDWRLHKKKEKILSAGVLTYMEERLAADPRFPPPNWRQYNTDHGAPTNTLDRTIRNPYNPKV